MDKSEQITFVQAIKDFFGYTDNGDLMRDYKKLTAADKEEIRAGLVANGYSIKPA